MFLKKSCSSDGDGDGLGAGDVCALTENAAARITNGRTTLKRHCERLFLRMLLSPLDKGSCYEQLLAYDQHYKRIRLDAALRPATGRRGRRFGDFSRAQKDFLCLRIERDRPRARLRLHWPSVFIIIRRLLVKCIQHAFAAREENQL